MQARNVLKISISDQLMLCLPLISSEHGPLIEDKGALGEYAHLNDASNWCIPAALCSTYGSSGKTLEKVNRSLRALAKRQHDPNVVGSLSKEAG